MSPFIVVVVVGACTWVVARAATQPVEPATAGASRGRERPRRERHGRRTGRPGQAPAGGPVPVGAPLPAPEALATLLAPPATDAGATAGPAILPPEVDLAPEFAPPEPEPREPDPAPLPAPTPVADVVVAPPTPDPEAGLAVADEDVDGAEDDVEVDVEVEVATIDRGRPLGVRSDPGEPAVPTPLVERLRSLAILAGIAVGLGLVLAASVGILFLVAFVLLRSAFG